jgi:hypothetical protein
VKNMRQPLYTNRRVARAAIRREWVRASWHDCQHFLRRGRYLVARMVLTREAQNVGYGFAFG